MNDLKIFENNEFGQIRTIEENGNVLFCGSDIAKALGYDQPHKAVERHCKKNGGTFHTVIDSLGREQQARFINEGNLYRLIANSKLPSAEKFEGWIFDEVLPSIRKHGAYIPEELSPQLQFLINMELKQKQLETAVNETKQEVQAIRDTIIINPKAEWRKETNKILTNIGIVLNDFANAKNEAYKALEERGHCRPGVLVTNLKNRALLNGMSKSKADNLGMLDVLENEPRLREIYISIVKEMAIKYKVA